MKKSNLLLTMLMLMCFSVGSWAADYELVYTLDGSVTTGGNSNYAQDGGGLTQDGISWSVTGNTMVNPWRIGGKNLTNEDRLAYSKTAISDNVAKIEIEHGGITLSAVNSVKVEVASNADFSTILETFTTTTVEANKTITHLRPSGQDWSNAYYRITYNVTAGSSNSYIQLKSVKFYKEKEATTEPSISIEQNGSAVTSVNFGEVASYTETENEGYVVCQSVDIKASNLNGDVYLEVENSDGNYFSIYDPRYAVTSWDKFTIKPTAGAIDTTIVLKAATWMSAGTKTGKLKVSSKASTADFTALNIDLSVTVFDPEEGDYDISLNNTFFGLSATGANPDEQTGSQDGITLIAGCTSTAQNKTYYDAAHVRFYGDSYLQICAPYGFVVDTIRFTAGGTWNGGISANVGTYDADKKEWSGSASCVTFSFTAQDRISKATVSIIKAPEVGLPTISGQTPFYPSTTVTMSIETEGADIIYTIDGEDPLGGDNTYSQPLVLTETKTVKARGFKGVKLGDVVTKVFTKATPISVADAIELIPDAGNTKNDQFVVGYVCTASESEPSNGQMTYYISDNGSTVDEGTATTDRIQIYKGKGLNNADFSAISDIALGDKVVVYGQLKNYNGTYEMNSGNYIVERTAKGAVSSLDLTGTNTKTEFEYGDHFDPAMDGSYTVKAIYANGYSEDVTSLVTWDIDGTTIDQKEIQGSGSCALTATYSGKSDWVYINISKILKHKITFSAPENGTLKVTWLGSAISSGDEFVKTYEFKVIATPAAGYELATLTANGVDIKETKAFVMGTEDIVVAATFSKKAEGVLKLYNNGVVDFGAVKVGTTSVGTGVLRIDATKLTPNSDLEVSIDGTDDYFEIQVPSDGKIDVDENGEIDYFAINIAVTSTALATYGEKTATLRLHSNDLAADSLATIKLIVGGIVTTTPSPVALDLGDVLNNDEPTLYGKKFHVKVTNLSANKQARVVPSTASFYADPYYLTADGNGVIDRDVTILPNLNGGGAAVYNADLEVVCTGTREFKDIKVGTVTMNLLEAYRVIVPTISNGSLSWDGGAAPKAARSGTTHTLVAVPASGYGGGTIQILKNSDDSDVTSTVLSGSTLTMPSYAIKIVVSGFEAQAHPSGLGWRYNGADVTTHAHTFGASTERFYFPSLKNPNEIDLNDIEFISSDSTVAEFGTRSHESSSWFVAVWVKKAGTAVMTARLKNHATYDDIEVSYTLTVSKGDLTSSQFRWSQYPDIENPETDTYTWYESHSWPSVVATSYVDKANEVTYESTDESVATISSTGTITPVAVGSTVIKANFIGNDLFNAKSVQFTLNVQKASPVLSWSVTPSTENTTVDMKYSFDLTAFPRFGSVSPNVEALRDLVVISSSDPKVAEINSNGYVNPLAEGQTTIKLSLAATDKSNAAEELSYTFTVTDSRPTLTIVAGDHGTYQVKDNSGTYVIESGSKVKANTNLYLVSQSAETGYKNTPVYKVVKTADNTDVTAAAINGSYLRMQAFDITISATYPEKQVAPIGWSSTETQYAYTDNRPYTLPTLVNAGLPVSFASSNTNVATISYDGSVSVWSAGTTNISVSYAGDGNYKQTTVSYELVVRSPNHLNVKGQPTKLMYDYGETINFTGMTATLYYDAEKTDGVDVTDVANWYSTPATVTASGYMTLTASYKGKQDSKQEYIYLKQYTVSFSKPTHGTIVVKQNGNAISTGDQFPKGTVLTVETTPEEGYALATLTANGVDIMATKQFTIGTEDVTIVATFKQGPSLVSNTYSIDFGEAIINTTDASNRPYLSSTFILTGSNLTGDIRLEATTNSGGSIFSVDWSSVKEYSPVDGAFYLTIPTQMATGWIGDFYGKITISSKANPADFEPIVINLHGKITDKHEAGLSWGVTEYDLYPVGPASTTRPELSNPNNLLVTYSSSNPAVATVSEGGWVSVVASGDAVITASYAGNDTYKAGSASFTVHVHKANSIQIKGGLQKTYGYEAGDQLDFTGLIAKLKYDGDDNTYQLDNNTVVWSADPISVNYLPNQCGLTVTASAYGVSGTKEVFVTVNLHAVTFTNPQYGYLNIKNGDSWISSGESFPKGTELTVVANPVEGYVLNSITVNGEVLEGNTFTVGAEAMEVVVTFKPKSGTGIDQVELEQQIRKEFRDGKLYILRGGKTYDAAGRLVK